MFAVFSVGAAMILVMCNAYHYQATSPSQEQSVLLEWCENRSEWLREQRLCGLQGGWMRCSSDWSGYPQGNLCVTLTFSSRLISCIPAQFSLGDHVNHSSLWCVLISGVNATSCYDDYFSEFPLSYKGYGLSEGFHLYQTLSRVSCFYTIYSDVSLFILHRFRRNYRIHQWNNCCRCSGRSAGCGRSPQPRYCCCVITVCLSPSSLGCR